MATPKRVRKNEEKDYASIYEEQFVRNNDPAKLGMAASTRQLTDAVNRARAQRTERQKNAAMTNRRQAQYDAMARNAGTSATQSGYSQYAGQEVRQPKTTSATQVGGYNPTDVGAAARSRQQAEAADQQRIQAEQRRFGLDRELAGRSDQFARQEELGNAYMKRQQEIQGMQAQKDAKAYQITQANIYDQMRQGRISQIEKEQQDRERRIIDELRGRVGLPPIEDLTVAERAQRANRELGEPRRQRERRNYIAGFQRNAAMTDRRQAELDAMNQMPTMGEIADPRREAFLEQERRKEEQAAIQAERAAGAQGFQQMGANREQEILQADREEAMAARGDYLQNQFDMGNPDVAGDLRAKQLEQERIAAERGANPEASSLQALSKVQEIDARRREYENEVLRGKGTGEMAAARREEVSQAISSKAQAEAKAKREEQERIQSERREAEQIKQQVLIDKGNEAAKLVADGEQKLYDQLQAERDVILQEYNVKYEALLAKAQQAAEARGSLASQGFGGGIGQSIQEYLSAAEINQLMMLDMEKEQKLEALRQAEENVPMQAMENEMKALQLGAATMELKSQFAQSLATSVVSGSTGLDDAQAMAEEYGLENIQDLIIRAAKAEIKAGQSPEVVKQNLIELGIDPALLTETAEEAAITGNFTETSNDFLASLQRALSDADKNDLTLDSFYENAYASGMGGIGTANLMTPIMALVGSLGFLPDFGIGSEDLSVMAGDLMQTTFYKDFAEQLQSSAGMSSEVRGIRDIATQSQGLGFYNDNYILTVDGQQYTMKGQDIVTLVATLKASNLKIPEGLLAIAEEVYNEDLGTGWMRFKEAFGGNASYSKELYKQIMNK